MFYITSIIILLVYSILDILKSNFTKKRYVRTCMNKYGYISYMIIYVYIYLYIFMHEKFCVIKYYISD